MSVRVIGIDTGFSSLGYAVCRLDKTGDVVWEEVGVLHTAKSDKKRNVRASDDNLRRIRGLYAMLSDVLVRHAPSVLCAETMSWPRNSAIVAKMGMSWGVLGALVELNQLPVAQASPQEIKLVAAGSKSASKEEVADAMKLRFPGQFDAYMAATNKTDLEHGFDAAATVVACLDSDVVQLARKMV